MLGYANYAFVKETTLSTGNGSQPRSFAIDDFNHDGHNDIAVANSRANNVGIFLGYGNYSFAHQVTYATGTNPQSIAIGDFNNDTNLDMVVANTNDSSISILLGYGNGSFENQLIYPTGFNSQPYSVAVADFNNDTKLDIIFANHGSNNVAVLMGYGDGMFASAKFFSIGYGTLPFSVVVSDLNNDRKLDFITANEGTDNLKVFLRTC
ncbi:unnamed protein product [Rotaria sordida]|uniref:VCBS repeat-containing protein n=2 Tax=Rotaria sordida TaxID=392033 RepID=A0A815G5L1_9BILA|nr:unnamed protein product [Rotaria sordida]